MTKILKSCFLLVSDSQNFINLDHTWILCTKNLSYRNCCQVGGIPHTWYILGKLVTNKMEWKSIFYFWSLTTIFINNLGCALTNLRLFSIKSYIFKGFRKFTSKAPRIACFWVLKVVTSHYCTQFVIFVSCFYYFFYSCSSFFCFYYFFYSYSSFWSERSGRGGSTCIIIGVDEHNLVFGSVNLCLKSFVSFASSFSKYTHSVFFKDISIFEVWKSF